MNRETGSTLERQLVSLLKEEYTFYQSLYILLDKQRDMINYERDDKLLDLYAEVERCRRRIQDSDEKISGLMAQNSEGFRVASSHPAVRKLVNSITTLVRKNMVLVTENENVVQGRYDRIKKELEKLKNSSKILKYMADAHPSPQFVDGQN